MRFLALATDYDGTLAHDGKTPPFVIEALNRLRSSGRRVILVTGRELPDLQRLLPALGIFDLVVAENGALLYFPQERREMALAEPPPAEFIQDLRDRGISPLSVGTAIVASWETEAARIIESIQAYGLELQLIFNKGALMVLPSGTNKASGLAAALSHLGLSRHNVAGIGDAENDHAFLRFCECSVAVANALPALRQRADLVTAGDHGHGVAELVEMMIRDDLSGVAARLARHDVLIGSQADGSEVRIPASGHNIIVAGSSGAGKSTLTTTFVERLLECDYQFCLVDPEGDFGKLEGAVVLGGPKSRPTADEALAILAKPDRSLVVDLTGFHLDERPAFFQTLLLRLHEMRARQGRPHWIVVDEAHHVMPSDRSAPQTVLPPDLSGVLMITVRPEHVLDRAVGVADTLIAVGEDPAAAYRAWIEITGGAAAGLPEIPLPQGHAFLWNAKRPEPVVFQVAPFRTERTRHDRKYAEGELPPEQSFYFRGAENKLNLRAQNLMMFLQLADGVDDETWLHHLRRGEYSAWLRRAIHEDALADAAEAIEKDRTLSGHESRKRIREEIEKLFTLPA